MTTLTHSWQTVEEARKAILTCHNFPRCRQPLFLPTRSRNHRLVRLNDISLDLYPAQPFPPWLILLGTYRLQPLPFSPMSPNTKTFQLLALNPELPETHHLQLLLLRLSSPLFNCLLLVQAPLVLRRGLTHLHLHFVPQNRDRTRARVALKKNQTKGSPCVTRT